MVRFDRLMESVNLQKLGKILMAPEHATVVPYYYNFITRYLNMNNVNRSMYHPKCLGKLNRAFYGEILYDVAVRAYFDSL
jgi:hypothetical protein